MFAGQTKPCNTKMQQDKEATTEEKLHTNQYKLVVTGIKEAKKIIKLWFNDNNRNINHFTKETTGFRKNVTRKK